MRIPYIPDPPPASSATAEAVIQRIRARRAPGPLIPLDLALLHSPPVADGWNSLLGAIRTQTSLPADVREVAICRVAVLNEAWFEWEHHAPLALAAGVTEGGVRGLLRVGREGGVRRAQGQGGSEEQEEDAEGLTERQAAVKAYADAMTRDVAVPDGVFARVRALFDDKEVVEITATVATYNCVSRFLVALDVGERNGKGPRVE